jgi:hypothetical protein
MLHCGWCTSRDWYGFLGGWFVGPCCTTNNSMERIIRKISSITLSSLLNVKSISLKIVNIIQNKLQSEHTY